MSEVDNTQTGDQNAETPQVDELTMLKERAKLMGIQHSGNIGVETLRQKIQAHIDGTPDPTIQGDETNALDPAAAPVNREETKQEMRDRIYADAMRLVRVRIMNLDPKKKDLPGEIFTVGNEIIGTVRKYIPYGEASDAGYHVPKILYDELKSREFLDIRTSNKAGQIQVTQRMAREFSLEVLPPLTEHELARLAASQAAAGTFVQSGSSV